MSEVNVQIQNPQQTVNINNPSIVIEIPTDSIEVEITEQALEIQVQNPVIEVNIGGPCDCSGGGGHTIEDEGTPLTQRDTLNFTGDGVAVTDSGGKTVVTIPGGGGTWGSITGTLSDQTDLQTALDGKVDENAAITGATKTKITYDAKGLVTAGADAAIADITGLQTALDGKAASSHTHPLSDLTQSGATLNQIPKWNGSAWVPADDETGGGGSVEIIDITYADMETALSGSTLTPGQFYRITDAAGTDLGFICQAIRENEITVNGTGGYLNADFQGNGDYGGVETETGVEAGEQKGIWRIEFEYLTISYANLDSAYIDYSSSTGLLDNEEGYTVPGTPAYIYYTDATAPFSPGETITGVDNGSTAVVISDDGNGTLEVEDVAGDWTTETVFYGEAEQTANYDGYDEATAEKTGAVITDTGARVYLIPNEPLSPGETVTGDASGNSVTVDLFYEGGSGTFSVGDTIAGATTGATAIIITDDGAGEMTVRMTSPGTAFDGSEPLDNGSVIAHMDGNPDGPEIQQGDIVIWGLLHYQLTDDTLLDGTNPDANTDAYTLLEKTVTQAGYIETWDISEFDFPANSIEYRSDTSGNTCRGDSSGFQWENNGLENNTIIQSDVQAANLLADFFNNSLNNGNIYDIACSGGQVSNNTIVAGGINSIDSSGSIFIDQNELITGSIYEITCGDGLEIGFNTMKNEGYIGNGTTSGNNLQVYRNIIYGSLLSNCTIGDDVQFNNNSISQDAEVLLLNFSNESIFSSNILENNAAVTGITAGEGCEISRNKIGQGATLGGDMVLEDGALVNDNTILNGLTVSNKTFAAGVEFSGNTIGVDMTETETIEESITGKRAIPGFSDVPGTIDITGLTALDFTAAWAQYRGVYNLTSSNATETIAADSLSNFPTLFPFRLIPASGLTLTLTGTAAASATNGSIVMSGATIVLDGTNGDFVELEADSTGTFVRVKNVQIYA